MSESLHLQGLQAAVSGTAPAFRSKTTLQPVGGAGDKVFPPTYTDAKYATEKRRGNSKSPDGKPIDIECVLLDSVPSQANRAEESLLSAVRQGALRLPLIEVNFDELNARLRSPLARLTSLEVPHRLADAILRDSELLDGTRFSKSQFATKWGRANVWNATPIYELCPTALVFGMWGSPLKPGGLGAKFERAYVSEIVGVDTTPVPERYGFRLDPLNSSKDVPIVKRDDGSFVLDSNAKGNTKPSNINHGNVPYPKPNTRLNGGVRFDFAEQTTVVSLGALRKLHFPIGNKTDSAIDDAGRTVLAALALCAGVLASENGGSLRSRCHLWPVAPREWELLEHPGQDPRSFSITGDQSIALFDAAVAAAEAKGLVWNKELIQLRPTKELAELIQRSQEVQAKESDDAS